MSCRLSPVACLLLLCLAGCAPVGGRLDGREERGSPAPVSPPVEAAAARFVGEFAEAWAVEAEATAARSDEWTSWEAAFGDWTRRNQAARQRAFEPLAAALDQATGGESAAYDAAALARAAREMAAGYRRSVPLSSGLCPLPEGEHGTQRRAAP